MVKTLLVSSFLLSTLISFGQVNVDSLKSIWESPHNHDTIRLQALGKIVNDVYLYTQPDSAYFYAELQYDFAKERGARKQEANALGYMGIVFLFKGEYATSSDYLRKSLTIREEIGDKKGIAASLNNIGLIYDYQGDLANAIDYYTRGLAISEEINDEKTIAYVLLNIGTIYGIQEDYDIATDYFTRGLGILEELGLQSGIASALSNIGTIYLNQGDYATARDYLARTLKIDEETGQKAGMAHSMNKIAQINFKLGKYDSAYYYNKRSLDIQREIDDKNGISNSLTNIGQIYFEQGKYDSAIVFTNRALTIANEIGDILCVKESAGGLYKVYKAIGLSQSALEMYELYITARDSILSEENQNAVIRQEYKYKYESKAMIDSVAFAKEQKIKDLQISEQNAQIQSHRYLVLTLVIGLVLSGLLGAISLHNSRVKQKINLIIERQNKELEQRNKEISLFNFRLAQLVKERTLNLEKAMEQLGVYQFDLVHKIRVPIAALLGTMNLIKNHNVNSKENRLLFEIIEDSSKKLDLIIREIAEDLHEAMKV